MGKWWSNKGDEETDTEIKAKETNEIELKPEEVKSKLDKIDSLESEIKTFSSKTAVLDRMTSFLDEQEAAKAKTKADELAKKALENKDDIENKWMTDPQGAFKEQINPLVAMTIKNQSKEVRRDMFEDGTQYEYYKGEFKARVDAYIDKLPLNAQVDPASIKNCYNIVLGESMQDIRDGKIKSRFAASATASAKDGSVNTDSKKQINLTDEQKRAAKLLGVPEDKYAANYAEMSL